MAFGQSDVASHNLGARKFWGQSTNLEGADAPCSRASVVTRACLNTASKIVTVLQKSFSTSTGVFFKVFDRIVCYRR